jgi:hypothetical protein
MYKSISIKSFTENDVRFRVSAGKELEKKGDEVTE